MSALPESDDQILLLHNPLCSKSRAVRALLAERGVAFAERRYLEAPLARGELGELALRLGLPARQWVRTGESAYAEAGIGAGASEAELLDAMARRPILMERPILVRGRRAVVGRPPEKVLSLLGP
jgi:arsenate reductase